MSLLRSVCCAFAASLCSLTALAQDAAYFRAQQNAQAALQQDIIMHHYIIPEQQRAAAAAQAQREAQRGTVEIVERYHYHAPGYAAFAIGSEVRNEARHKEGYLMVRTYIGSGGTSYYKGVNTLEGARAEALRDCAGSERDMRGRCQIIAEVGNTCMAVAKGSAYSTNDDIARTGIHGTLYTRFYVAMLDPQERGDPQSEPSDAQINHWRTSLAERALRMCEADHPDPLHQCEKDVWSRCGIDGIETGSTGIYR